MVDLITKLRTSQIRAAEEAVIASIPRDLIDRLDKAQAEHEAKGGCPGCGCMVLACHAGDCPTNADDLY
jgi:hypothetical protein